LRSVSMLQLTLISFVIRCSSLVELCLILSPGLPSSNIFHNTDVRVSLTFLSLSLLVPLLLSVQSLNLLFASQCTVSLLSVPHVGCHFTATILSYPYKNLTSSRWFPYSISEYLCVGCIRWTSQGQH
jgi:hypothetical protein